MLSLALIVAMVAGAFVWVSERPGAHLAVSLFVIALTAIAAVIVSSASPRLRSSASASSLGLVVFGVGLLVVSSTFANPDWLRRAGMHVSDDQRYTHSTGAATQPRRRRAWDGR